METQRQRGKASIVDCDFKFIQSADKENENGKLGNVFSKKRMKLLLIFIERDLEVFCPSERVTGVVAVLELYY